MKALVKDRLMAEIAAIDLTEREENGFNACVECIERMLTVEIQSWIPVSEGLPKSNGVYEVTMRSEEGVYRSACYFDGQDTWHNDNRINFGRPFANDKVIAWKPETEPYKESEWMTNEEEG